MLPACQAAVSVPIRSLLVNVPCWIWPGAVCCRRGYTDWPNRCHNIVDAWLPPLLHLGRAPGPLLPSR